MIPVMPPDAVRRVREWLVRATPYFAVALLSLVAAYYLLDLRNANLRVPFVYRRDALLYAAVIKSVVDHGWFWRNPSIGAPSGLLLYDYPNVAHEAVHLLAIKALSIFTGNWALLLNVYFVLGFPLIAVAAMVALRQLGVGRGAAAVGSILYAFLPARLLKNEGHIFLATFFQVPFVVLMLVWVSSGDAAVALVADVRSVAQPIGAPSPPGHRGAGDLRNQRGHLRLLLVLHHLPAGRGGALGRRSSDVRTQSAGRNCACGHNDRCGGRDRLALDCLPSRARSQHRGRTAVAR